MKRNQYIFLGMVFIAIPSLVQAQTQPKDTTLNRTVVVEQEYNPIIMDAAKVNVLPKVEEPVVNKKRWNMLSVPHRLRISRQEPCRPIREKRHKPRVIRDMYA